MKTMEREFRKRQLALMRKHFGEARIQRSPLFIPGEFPVAKFDFKELSKNPNITVEFFTAHIDEPWDFAELSQNHVSFALFRAFPHKPWNNCSMCHIQNPDWDFVRENLGHLSVLAHGSAPDDIFERFKRIANRDISHWLTPVRFMSDPDNVMWNLVMASGNPNFTWDFIMKFPQYKWDFNRVHDRTFPTRRRSLEELWSIDNDYYCKNATSVDQLLRFSDSDMCVVGREDLPVEEIVRFAKKAKRLSSMFFLDIAKNRTLTFEVIMEIHEINKRVDIRPILRNDMAITCARWCATLRALGELCMRSSLSFDVAREIFAYL